MTSRYVRRVEKGCFCCRYCSCASEFVPIVVSAVVVAVAAVIFAAAAAAVVIFDAVVPAVAVAIVFW